MSLNAINFAFPPTTQPYPNAVFTEQTNSSYEQASGWLESCQPLYHICVTGGLDPEEAWQRVLIFTKTVFEDVKTVRTVTFEKVSSAMIWGSFQTNKVLQEYLRLRFTQHPQVSYIMAQTSMQRKGKTIQEAAASLKASAELLKSLDKDLKELKKKVN